MCNLVIYISFSVHSPIVEYNDAYDYPIENHDYSPEFTSEINVAQNSMHSMQANIQGANINSFQHTYLTGFDKSRLERTHQANSFSTTNR